MRLEVRNKKDGDKMSSQGGKKVNPVRSPAFVKYFKFSLIAIIFLAALLIFFTFNKSDDNKYENVRFVQFEEYSDDTDVAVYETTLGTFKAVLFENEAPNYVKYYKKLIESGYYNDSYVFGVVTGNEKENKGAHLYFTGGSKTADGETTDATNTETIDAEISPDLWAFKGALGSFVGTDGLFFWKKNVAGSSVMFFGNSIISDEKKEEVKNQDNIDSSLESVYNELSDKLCNYGGVPEASQQYTIFGQVCDGWDAYNKILRAEVKDIDNDDYQPVDDIKFKKVYLTTWGKIKSNAEGPVDPNVGEDNKSEENSSQENQSSKAEDKDAVE